MDLFLEHERQDLAIYHILNILLLAQKKLTELTNQIYEGHQHLHKYKLKSCKVCGFRIVNQKLHKKRFET